MSAKSRFTTKAPRKTVTVKLSDGAEEKVDVQPVTLRQRAQLIEAAGGTDEEGSPKDPERFARELLALVTFEHGSEEKLFSSADECMDVSAGDIQPLVEAVVKAAVPPAGAVAGK